jgi:hypothetical protein
MRFVRRTVVSVAGSPGAQQKIVKVASDKYIR